MSDAHIAHSDKAARFEENKLEVADDVMSQNLAFHLTYEIQD